MNMTILMKNRFIVESGPNSDFAGRPGRSAMGSTVHVIAIFCVFFPLNPNDFMLCTCCARRVADRLLKRVAGLRVSAEYC